MPLADSSQDFGYSLGVLHHIPDTAKALQGRGSQAEAGCAVPASIFIMISKVARDGSAGVWRASELGRAPLSRLPFAAREGGDNRASRPSFIGR